MSDEISFSEERTNITSYKTHGGIIGFLIKKCGVGSEETANVILVIITLVMFSLTAYVLYGALK